MPSLYRSLSISSIDTNTANSQFFCLRSRSNLAKKSAFLCLLAVSSASFFISNIMDTYSVPSSLSLKMKSPLLPSEASLSFSKTAAGITGRSDWL